MNKVILVGNLTKEPDLRTTESGISKCGFTLAVTRRYTNAQGERQTDFIPVIAWRGQGENCAKYLHKGSKAGVCGSLQVRSYEAKDGGRRYITEVIADEVQFLDGRNQGRAQQQGFDPDALPDFTDVNYDDLPF